MKYHFFKIYIHYMAEEHVNNIYYYIFTLLQYVVKQTRSHVTTDLVFNRQINWNKHNNEEVSVR